MNDSEARRKELLTQARKMSRNALPASPGRVHRGRNSAFFPSEFSVEAEETALENGSFLIRLGICILCFVGFVWMDSGKIQPPGISCDKISQQIEREAAPEEIQEKLIQVWKDL